MPICARAAGEPAGGTAAIDIDQSTPTTSCQLAKRRSPTAVLPDQKYTENGFNGNAARYVSTVEPIAIPLGSTGMVRRCDNRGRSSSTDGPPPSVNCSN